MHNDASSSPVSICKQPDIQHKLHEQFVQVMRYRLNAGTASACARIPPCGHLVDAVIASARSLNTPWSALGFHSQNSRESTPHIHMVLERSLSVPLRHSPSPARAAFRAHASTSSPSAQVRLPPFRSPSWTWHTRYWALT